MKLSVSSRQHEYYEANHLIEFEGIFSAEELADLRFNIEKTLASRLKCHKEHVFEEPREKLLLAGVNLWQGSPFLNKMITSSRLSRVASELSNQKPLRMGYDVYISPGNAPYFHPLRPFHEICCIQGFIGGILVCLEGEKQGNIAAFDPEIFLDPSTLFNGSPFILITYAHPASLFIRKPSDPLNLVFQNRGYRYGDRLADNENPIIYK